MQACAQNQRIDGEIMMFETDSQTGETVHFFSLHIGNGRITARRLPPPIPQREVGSSARLLRLAFRYRRFGRPAIDLTS